MRIREASLGPGERGTYSAGNHAEDVSAAVERRSGYGSHEPGSPAAIDEGAIMRRKRASDGLRRRDVRWRRAA